jgi:hypothetical protein
VKGVNSELAIYLPNILWRFVNIMQSAYKYCTYFYNSVKFISSINWVKTFRVKCEDFGTESTCGQQTLCPTLTTITGTAITLCGKLQIHYSVSPQLCAYTVTEVHASLAERMDDVEDFLAKVEKAPASAAGT